MLGFLTPDDELRLLQLALGLASATTLLGSMLLLAFINDVRYKRRMLRNEVAYRLPLLKRLQGVRLYKDIPAWQRTNPNLRHGTYFDKRISKTINVCWIEATLGGPFFSAG